MVGPDIPPEAEGEIDGGADDVRPIVADKPAATVSRVADL